MDAIKTQKLNMWQKKLTALKSRYDAVMQRRGEAIAMGDLRENAAFQDADEESAVVRQQLTEVEAIIAKISNGQDTKTK